MSCPDCGHNLDDLSVGDACPGCGGTRRSTHVTVSAALGVASIPRPTIEVAYNPAPGWTQQWGTVQFHLERLRRQYRDDMSVGNQEMGETVASVMLALWHVKDWLEKDASVPAELRRKLHGELWDTFPDKDALKICNACANTSKHSQRSGAPDRPSRNHKYRSDGPTMTIECDGELIDALDLAQRCEQAWLKLLNKHGVEIP